MSAAPTSVEPSTSSKFERSGRRVAILALATLMTVWGAAPLLAQATAGAGSSDAVTPGWQPTPWADSVMLQSQIFFSLASADGKGVSEQQWAQFVAETVVPRFPTGFTVIEASGIGRHGVSGTGGPVPLLMATDTRLLLIVHPNTPDAQSKLGQIKAEYAARFGQSRAFHVDFPVRTVN